MNRLLILATVMAGLIPAIMRSASAAAGHAMDISDTRQGACRTSRTPLG
jgi:hypothetical protein